MPRTTRDSRRRVAKLRRTQGWQELPSLGATRRSREPSAPGGQVLAADRIRWRWSTSQAPVSSSRIPRPRPSGDSAGTRCSLTDCVDSL